MTSAVNTWHKARESADWVGPIVCTLTIRGTTAPTTDGVQFAVLPRGQRPAEGDWAEPRLDPDGGGALGVWQAPVAEHQELGIWARMADSPETPVLEPKSVGWIIRT